MKTVSLLKKPFVGKTSAIVLLSSLLLSACAMAPETSTEALDARQKLTELQRNPAMASNARIELRDAEAAVQLAEQPLDSDEAMLADHRIYMADRMVEIARATGTTRQMEADRKRLGEERDAARLAARTLEADAARADADTARSSELEAAAVSAKAAQEMQRQIDELEAEATERGLVLTLGDVLFATGSADLQGGSNRNLEKLVDFLKTYPDRNVLIEGHTDNVGSAQFNQTLSLKRADSVRRYLTDHGVQSRRLTVSGLGLERPVAGNESAMGRQQNRRVEVIIEN
ncbi:Outer membrane protein OmpA [Marinobacter gudaonensis]|uniref:Outer membrane protein OmpA n=1 Tax=Marinobacter gudaonensis TaxID=375760 RepID=A0A1I6GAE2_9GAMM|nr:OmpA family protein [Marinobacter gudaonensis]SFR39129.1 Outer membrane protein OmpA [Marinobacter gudaonensis]